VVTNIRNTGTPEEKGDTFPDEKGDTSFEAVGAKYLPMQHHISYDWNKSF
jgi:hypothetical protein